MTPPTEPRPIVILGPTAGGKSELAVSLAEHYDGEVIGADSMQVYRHLDAGTAKPPPSLRDRAPHHLIDCVEPTRRFTVADWCERAEQLIADTQSRGVRPVIVGGTNLYLVALLEGMFDGPPADDAFRESLNDVADAELHERLRAVDPPAAERIPPSDRKRIVRALEVFHATGQPITQWQQQWSAPQDSGVTTEGYRFSPLLLGLDWPVEAINTRINLRVKAMFYPEKVDPQIAAEVCLNGESLPDEVKCLREAGLLGSQAREALGYKQVLAWLERSDSKIKSLDDAFERTKILTRRFAKQQRTWFKRFRGAAWLEMPDDQAPIADRAIAHLDSVL